METQDKSGKKEKSILEKIRGDSIEESIDFIIRTGTGLIGLMLLIVIMIAIIKAAINIVR